MVLSKIILTGALIGTFFLSAPAKSEITDLYWKPIMPHGPHQGKPLERMKDRPVIHLQGDALSERSFDGRIDDVTDPAKSNLLVANIFHKGAFYVAKIDLNKVKHSYFWFEKFMPLVAHAMVRFEMADESPIELIAKLPTQEEWAQGIKYTTLEQPIKVKDLIMSFDSEWTVGNGPFNPVKGVLKNYTGIYRFLSIDSFVDTYFSSRPFPVEQYKLNLSVKESASFFRNLLDRSAHYGVSKGFNTYCNNCTNNPVESLKESVPLAQRDGGRDAGFFRRYYNAIIGEKHPNLVPGFLMKQGWRDADSQLPNVESDPRFAGLFKAAFMKSLTALKLVPKDSKKFLRLGQNLDAYKPMSCLKFYHQ